MLLFFWLLVLWQAICFAADSGSTYLSAVAKIRHLQRREANWRNWRCRYRFVSADGKIHTDRSLGSLAESLVEMAWRGRSDKNVRAAPGQEFGLMKSAS